MAYLVRKSSNKYKAKRTEYGGKKFDSKGEAAYAEELDWRIKAGEIRSYERQVKITLKVNGHFICNYYIDFVVTDKHGGIELHEYKGMVLPLWELKWKLLEALKEEIYPGAEMIVIKHHGYKSKLFK